MLFDIHSLTVLLEDGIERGELASDAPVSILAYTLADILYGEMLCWDMSGGAYCYAKRTEEFCNLFLGSIMASVSNKKGRNTMKKLGFGLMRLPVIDGKPDNIDLNTLSQMVDLLS